MSDQTWVPKPEALTVEEIRAERANGFSCSCGREHLGWWLCPYHLGFNAGVEAGADDLAGKLDEVHRSVDEMGGIWCDHDSQVWPCATYRIIHGGEQ